MSYESPIPRSAAGKEVLRRLSLFSRDESLPVLIVGETGTGKTRLAEELHRLSSRSRAAFERVLLSALDDELAGSHLFGHEAGAFTGAHRRHSGHFASANGGTIFLDEVGKASVRIQGRLLHAIEYGTVRPVGAEREIRVDVRIVCAMSECPDALVADGKLLPDFYARLRHFRIELPPLRERRADIPDLARELVARHATRLGYPCPEIADDLMEALVAAEWRMNVRELDCAIRLLILAADGAEVLDLAHCHPDLAHLDTGRRSGPLTREAAVAAVEAAGGNMAMAARTLHVNRSTVLRAVRRD